MKSLIPFYVLALSALSSALVLPTDMSAFGATAQPSEDLRLIQLSPTESRWTTEEQKLELKRVCRPHPRPRPAAPNTSSAKEQPS